MPKTEEVQLENVTAEWKVDVSDITTMKPVLAWQRCVKAGDLDGMIAFMAGRVKAWPYAGDPTNADAYGDLTPKQWATTLKEVSAAIGGVFQEAGN